MEIEIGKLIKKAKLIRCGDGEYPVLSMTMHDGLMFQNDRFKKQIASVDQSQYQVVQRHQLVESFPIDEGVLAVQELTDAGIVSPAYKIWDVDMEKVVPKYLEFALRAPKSIEYYKFKLRGTTARRRSIPDAEFCAMRIKCPSLDEQKIIVDTIEKTKRVIDSRNLELDTLDDLIKARFVEMFGDPVNNEKGWITDTVDNLCIEIYGGGTPSKVHPEYYEDGDIPWVSSKDMKTDILTDSQIKINQMGVENSTARMVPVNSVIMVIRSGILKHTLPVAINAVPITVNQDLKVFIPSERILTRFLAVQFKMHEKDILTGVRAVTADNIEFNSLKQRKLIVPSIELQQEYVLFLEQVDKSKSV